MEVSDRSSRVVVEYKTILALSALLMIVYGSDNEVLTVAVRIICGTMLVFPAALTHPAGWWTLLGTYVLLNSDHWQSLDNHKYLIGYWVFACALSTSMSDKTAYLRIAARGLIAIVFGFAVLWKCLAGQFFNGSFMYFTLLTDNRVIPFAASTMGVSVNEVHRIDQAISYFQDLGAVSTLMPVQASKSLMFLSLFLSWMGLGVEAMVCLLHLWPGTSVRVFRHVAIGAFIGMTYFMLPVTGFASILTILGLAQCVESERSIRNGYLVILAVVQMTRVPWNLFFG